MRDKDKMHKTLNNLRLARDSIQLSNQLNRTLILLEMAPDTIPAHRIQIIHKMARGNDEVHKNLTTLESTTDDLQADEMSVAVACSQETSRTLCTRCNEAIPFY